MAHPGDFEQNRLHGIDDENVCVGVIAAIARPDRLDLSPDLFLQLQAIFHTRSRIGILPVC
jgi:hypothetical protein